MTQAELEQRKTVLTQSLTELEKNYHVVTGHLNEVNFQLQKLSEMIDAEHIANGDNTPVE